MATYAIGDVQGCFTELQQLLREIQFDALQDTLWFTGDLVNRGPASLDVLRFVKALGKPHKIVLGNHDLSLLALGYGARKPQPTDTLDAVLAADDRNELFDWLRQQPLLHHENDYLLVHAGLAPMWTVQQARTYANEVEAVLQGKTPQFFLQHMFGNEPTIWDDHLAGTERLRCITNYLTRMRFCHEDGRLNLSYKGEIAGKPADLLPWFDVPNRQNANSKIIFGHWAALNGKTDVPNVYALDTGCVWGNCLTALRLDDEKRFAIKCG